MPVNTDLLRETLSYIEQHPEEWDQRVWHCGTTYCFAGHAARIANGGNLPRFDFLKGEAWFDRPARHGGHGIPEEASIALGLSEEQSDELFYATNDLETISVIVEKFCFDAAGQEES